MTACKAICLNVLHSLAALKGNHYNELYLVGSVFLENLKEDGWTKGTFSTRKLRSQGFQSGNHTSTLGIFDVAAGSVNSKEAGLPDSVVIIFGGGSQGEEPEPASSQRSLGVNFDPISVT